MIRQTLQTLVHRCLLLDKSAKTAGGGYLVDPAALDVFARNKDATAGFSCTTDSPPTVNDSAVDSLDCDIPPLELRCIVFVIQITGLSLSERLDQQLGRRGCNPLHCVQDVWWNSTDMREVAVLLVEDCIGHKTDCKETADSFTSQVAWR
jgi:hypothetical protein